MGRLGIIAGGGSMPGEVAAAAIASGRAVHMFQLGGIAGVETAGQHPTTDIPLGSIGRLLRSLRQQDCQEICIIGHVTRPDVKALKLDIGALMSLPTIFRLMVGGDDSVLSRVVRFFEAKGFRVVGAHEVAPELLGGGGPLGRHRPSRANLRDIALGMKVVDGLGRLDIGQGAVVARGHVLAVEAAEGTDRMLARCGELRQWGRKNSRRRAGVFSKRPKPGQELRIDMPVIGTETVRRAADAGLAGIALLAGNVMIAEREATIRLADETGLFLFGVEEQV
jgi:UDP-2,3-diacylglucosamine hydrolase